jgi:hypothetical protein
MPDEDRDQYRDEDDDDDTDGSRPAPITIVDYNWAISHTSHCSFPWSRWSARFIPRVQASVSVSGEASAMWVLSGAVLSGILAAVAWSRSFARSQSYYESEFYGMTPGSHRKYALAFTVAAAVFAAALAWPGVLGSPWPEAVLGIVVLTGILYGSGFLRGAAGEDE